MRRSVSLILLAVLLLAVNSAVHVSYASERQVLAVNLTGTITKASAELVEETILSARQSDAEGIIILLDTPGGDLDATIRIMETIDRSQVPVIAYVSPRGAKAWSAGTFILLSAHVAAMAPNTIIGSSQPVRYSPTGSEPINDPKIINALTALIVEKARMHGRNETAAGLFVTENLNLNDESAFRFNVIEAVASDMIELLVLINGRQVLTTGGFVTLETKGVTVAYHSSSARVSVLTVISDPILAFLLLTIGLYALIFGLASPGHAAEVVGAIALMIGLIGMGFDVSLVGALLLALGAILMIAEAYTPGFGIFGGAGLFCIVIGSILLIPFQTERWLISTEWYTYFLMIIAGIASVLGAFTFFMVYKIVQARRRRPVIGGMIGEIVQIIHEITPENPGTVKYHGEYWGARSNDTLRRGVTGRVIGKDGPLLVVEPE